MHIRGTQHSSLTYVPAHLHQDIVNPYDTFQEKKKQEKLNKRTFLQLAWLLKRERDTLELHKKFSIRTH